MESTKLIKIKIVWNTGVQVGTNLGLVYLAEDSRVSDLLNDERAFIPIEIVSFDGEKDVYSSYLIRKENIFSVEEITG